MATISEKQRRSRSNSTVNNMGVIFWQFNTDWQAPSWSTTDYSGNWKVSHNMIKSTFAELLVTSYFTNGTFNVWAVNDRLTTFVDAQVCVRLYQFNQTDDSARAEHCVT